MSLHLVSAVELLILALVPFAAWMSHLILCWLIVRRTGQTEGLRDLAEAARAFRRPWIKLPRDQRRGEEP